jgi:hypothetical protein
MTLAEAGPKLLMGLCAIGEDTAVAAREEDNVSTFLGVCGMYSGYEELAKVTEDGEDIEEIGESIRDTLWGDPGGERGLDSCKMGDDDHTVDFPFPFLRVPSSDVAVDRRMDNCWISPRKEAITA